MSYYTHEYSDEKFENYDDCKEDLIINMDICDYAEHISVEEILRKFFLKKSDDKFWTWLGDKVFEAEDAIAEELITEHEEDIDDAEIAMRESLGSNWW